MNAPYKFPYDDDQLLRSGHELNKHAHQIRILLIAKIQSIAMALHRKGLSTSRIQSILDSKIYIHVEKSSGKIIGFYPGEAALIAEGFDDYPAEFSAQQQPEADELIALSNMTAHAYYNMNMKKR